VRHVSLLLFPYPLLSLTGAMANRQLLLSHAGGGGALPSLLSLSKDSLLHETVMSTGSCERMRAGFGGPVSSSNPVVDAKKDQEDNPSIHFLPN